MSEMVIFGQRFLFPVNSSAIERVGAGQKVGIDRFQTGPQVKF